MGMAENVAAFVVVFVIALLIILIAYGGISSTHYFGLIMFRNQQAEKEARRQRRGQGRGRMPAEVMPAPTLFVPAEHFWAVPEPQVEAGTGPSAATHATQTSTAGRESQHRQTEESQQREDPTTDAGAASDASAAPSQTSSTAAQIGRH